MIAETTVFSYHVSCIYIYIDYIYIYLYMKTYKDLCIFCIGLKVADHRLMMVDDHMTREKYPLHPAWFLGIQRVPGGLGCQWSNLQSWGCVDKQCSNQWSSPVLDYTQPRLWGYELCSSMFQQQSRSFKCSTTTKNTRDKQAHLFTLFSKHVCILNESQWHQGNITSFFVGKQNQHVTFRQARKSLMLCGLAVRKHGSDSHRAWRPTIWHQTQ